MPPTSVAYGPRRIDFYSFLTLEEAAGCRWCERLEKKTDRPGEMASAFQNRHKGFGFRVTDSELSDFNKWRLANEKKELDSTPSIRYLCYTCEMAAPVKRRVVGLGEIRSATTRPG